MKINMHILQSRIQKSMELTEILLTPRSTLPQIPKLIHLLSDRHFGGKTGEVLHF